MAGVKGPLFSLDARGTIGDAIVYSIWKGRNYVRRHVIPANPRSGGQVGVRSMFKFLAQNWHGLADNEKADWIDRAAVPNVSPFNAFVGYNMDRWRHYLGPSQLDPATEITDIHGLANITSTAGVKRVTLSADSNGAFDPWGIIWYRSDTAIFTPSLGNVIAVVLSEVADTYEYIDGPLSAGTYFYNQGVINAEGFRSLTDFEHQATVA